MPFPSPKKDGSLGRQYSDAYLILSGSTEAEVEAAVAVWEEVFVYSNECREEEVFVFQETWRRPRWQTSVLQARRRHRVHTRAV